MNHFKLAKRRAIAAGLSAVFLAAAGSGIMATVGQAQAAPTMQPNDAVCYDCTIKPDGTMHCAKCVILSQN